MTQTQRPSITDAMRAVDEGRSREQISEEILAVTEDFVEYVARRGRGITMATPERRRLREAIERIVLSFVTNAEDPTALEARVPMRLDGIVSQSARLSSPQNGVESDPPPPPPDRMGTLSG